MAQQKVILVSLGIDIITLKVRYAIPMKNSANISFQLLVLTITPILARLLAKNQLSKDDVNGEHASRTISYVSVIDMLLYLRGVCTSGGERC